MRATTADRPGGCVLQFAKAPRAGRVKTRLQPELSAVAAAAVAGELIARVARALAAVPAHWDVKLAADQPDDPELARVARQHGRRLVAQGAGDLGQRMARLAQREIDRRGRVIIVGSDCLGYDAMYLAAAIAALERGCDAVLGSATDGGYVLIGLSRFDARVFRDIAWGEASVLESQRRNLRECAFGWEELPARSDIDTADDLRAAIGKGLLGAEWLRRE